MKARKSAKRQLQKQTKEQNEKYTSPQGGDSEEKTKLEVLRKLHWESAMATEAEDRRQKECRKSHNNKGNELLEKGGCEISRDLSAQHKFSHSHTQRNETSYSGRQDTGRPASGYESSNQLIKGTHTLSKSVIECLSKWCRQSERGKQQQKCCRVGYRWSDDKSS